MHKFRSYRTSIDIDYYTYFTKAYFAFNAYLKAKYPQYTDADKIKYMKDDTLVLQKFSQLIYEGKHFKDDLKSLRDTLGATVITNNGDVITFSNVKIGEHRVLELFNDTYNRVHYFIKAIENEKFTFTVNGIQPSPFRYEELEFALESVRLSYPQKDKIRNIVNSHVVNYNINLSEQINLLENLIELDIIEQEKIIKKLYRGFIEILYKLRNGLFHSEVEPTDEVMKVYKFAYFILRKILHKIPT